MNALRPSPRLGAPILALIALCGFLAQLILIWPGVATFDTVYIFEQIHGASVGNWHPPVFARLWQATLLLGAHGTGPVYVLQLALFWGGAGLWTCGLARGANPALAWGVLLAILLTPAIGFEQAIIKDAQMTAALVAATGICAWFRAQQRVMPWFAVAAVAILLVYAQLLRANAVFAVLPLAIMLAMTATPGRWRWRQGLMAGAAMTMLFLATPTINFRVLGAIDEQPERQIAIFDMAGMAHYGHLPTIANATPDDWRRAEARHCYQPFYWDPYSDPKLCEFISDAVFDNPGIWKYWRAELAAHPVEYLRHRLGHWNMSMRLFTAAGEPSVSPNPRGQPNPYGLGTKDNRLAALTFAAQAGLAMTPLYWPAFWFIVGFAVLWAGLTTAPGPGRQLALCLIVSALPLSASFLLVSIAADLRYHIWSMMAVAIASALIVLDPTTSRARLKIVLVLAGVVIVAGLAARVWMVPNWPVTS